MSKVDASWERPVVSRYTDPLELVWYATARRLGLTIRRNPHIFSMTDGTGLLELGPRESLDADDTAAQQIFHELCHWITNGVETFHERDWGFAVTDEEDWREFACLRLQAWLNDRYGLRGMFGPTGIYRQYYDRLPADPFAPLDGPDEAQICAHARVSAERALGAPWAGPLGDALAATAAMKTMMAAFLPAYQTDVPDDPLPSLWGR